MNRRVTLQTLACAALVTATWLLSGCGVFGRDDVYRFRVTVEVQTPQGVRTGSSVWQISPHVEAHPMAGSGVQLAFRGEAVAVDLPDGQTLFALMTGADGNGEYAQRMPGNALFSPLASDPPGTTPSGFRKSAELYPNAIRTVGLVNSGDALPMLVQFRDIRDPMSVEKVDPTNLAGKFGPGVALKRIVIETTDDPVTTGIEKRLGWLSDFAMRKARLNGSTSVAISSNDLSDNLESGSFSVGIVK